MPLSDAISIYGLWQRRPENPTEIVGRVRQYFALMRPCLPPDLRWWAYKDEHGTLSFDAETDTARLMTILAESADPNDDGPPSPHMGYRVTLYLASEDPSTKPARGAQLRLHAGASGFQNSVVFDTDVHFDHRADPRLTTYDALKANLMAAAWAFRPEWCKAAPGRLADFLDAEVYNRPFISLAWMIWLEASLATQIELPPRTCNLIVEPYSDGSLFMATGEEAFSCDNDGDLRGARSIHRQLDHLNFTVPFEGQCGRNPRVPPLPKL